METSLILRADEDIIRAVPEPVQTRTWSPISHGRLLNAMQMVADSEGTEIVNRQYTLTKNGNRLFGAWSIANGPDQRYMIGFRNSLDKSMAVGMCAGMIIVVCSNMVFSGDYCAFRKHTTGLTDDLLLEMSTHTWDAARGEQEKLSEWNNSLKSFPLHESDLEAVSFRALRAGLITPNKVKPYLEALDEEIKIAESLSLHTFHSGMTRLLRNDNLFSIASTTPRLAAFCNKETEPQEAEKKGFFNNLINRFRKG